MTRVSRVGMKPISQRHYSRFILSRSASRNIWCFAVTNLLQERRTICSKHMQHIK